MSHEPQLVIYADGGISPHRSGVGVVVQNPQGEVVLITNRSFPQTMNNTEAEYQGLLLALEVAQRFRDHAVEIRMDNEVVVYQMAGYYAVRSKHLKPLHRKACEMARQLRHVSYRHIPREKNLVANALAGEAVAGRRWVTKGA